MTDVIMYGIKNCDTIKKAKKWLDANQIDYQFHDYRQDGIDQAWLEQAVETLGWEQVLNKRGTTYRQLPDEIKSQMDEALAIKQMLEQPAMIKRPLLSVDGALLLGFTAQNYEATFKG